ncbi:MAG TPA: hypothetical protein VK474_00050 [Chthoniobacterales bacterium]|nr:hypothetical protein [Chthoniobacterales bacterium]
MNKTRQIAIAMDALPRGNCLTTDTQLFDLMERGCASLKRALRAGMGRA